jgi:hypothetical protein
MRTTHPAHLIVLDLTAAIMSGEILHCYVTSYHFCEMGAVWLTVMPDNSLWTDTIASRQEVYGMLIGPLRRTRTRVTEPVSSTYCK